MTTKKEITSELATIEVNINNKTCGIIKIPENTAKFLSEGKNGIFKIEKFLGEKLLGKMGYRRYPYGSKSLAIYLSNGKNLFSSVA